MFDYFLSYRNFNELVNNVNVSLFYYVLNNINIYMCKVSIIVSY